MWITVLLLVIFLINAGALFHEGLWSNAITLLNTITAALLATNWWEPLARVLDKNFGAYTYLWDFICLWGLFFLIYGVLRTVTDLLSRNQVRFKSPVNYIGSGFCAIWTAWVLVCFTAMTLHTAPLARNYMQGTFQPTPTAKMFFGMAPDQKWLAFVQKVSRGSLATSPSPGSPKDAKVNEFDPRAEFIFKYAQRRDDLEKQPGLAVRRD